MSIDSHILEGDKYTTAQLIEQLNSISKKLDEINVPNAYPNSPVPCSVRERVAILVEFNKAIGINWEQDNENK